MSLELMRMNRATAAPTLFRWPLEGTSSGSFFGDAQRSTIRVARLQDLYDFRATNRTPMKAKRTAPVSIRGFDARYAVPALDRGLDVIELLAREIDGLTLNEIARLLGRTSSELFRTLNALCRRGYIGQDGDRYSLTLKLFELAHRHKP